MATSLKNQYLAAVCVNLLTLSYGTICGWSSSGLLALQSEESALKSGPASDEEASWIGAIMCIGGLFGNIAFGWISNQFGRKISLILAAFPLTFSFLMIPYSTSVLHLCISRFIGGFSGSGSFAVIPIYITEISEDRVRGALGSTIMIFCNFGILTSFIFGNLFSYFLTPFLLAIFPVLFLCIFIFFPETPSYLLNSGKEDEALKSLKFFRCINSEKEPEELWTEFKKLKSVSTNSEEKSDDKITLADFQSTHVKKAMIIGLVLMILNQFCGIFSMLNYTASIFKQAGSSLSPQNSAVIVAFIQLLGSYVATLFVEKAGRKLLYLASTIGTGIGLSILGLYVGLSSKGYDCSGFQWVPIGSFSMAIFFSQLALLSLPFLVIAEILPPKVRSLGSNICLTILWFISFSVLKGLPIMVGLFELHGVMLLFSSMCFIGSVYIFAFLPETKGRSIDEIIRLLK